MTFIDPGLEVLPLVRTADIGVLMSNEDLHREGCSNAIMEYMSCALPVVCSAGGGNPELVLEGETGYLVSSGDSAALADALALHRRSSRDRAPPGRRRAPPDPGGLQRPPPGAQHGASLLGSARMKICLIDYRYFVSSGPERYMFAVKRLLEERGHEVIPFSVRYRQNEPSPWERYFVSPIAGDDEVVFRQHSWSISSVRRALERAFYSREVYDALSRELRDTRPDVAYVLKFLTEAVAVGSHCSARSRCADRGAALRFRPGLSPAASGQGRPRVRALCRKAAMAERSLPLRPRLVRCVGCERPRHGIRAAEGVLRSRGRVRRSQRHHAAEDGRGWICPTARIRELPTFVGPHPSRPYRLRNRRVCYVGRVERIKGIDVLLDAVEMLQHSEVTPRRRGGDRRRHVDTDGRSRPRPAARAPHPGRDPARAPRRGRRDRASPELAGLGRAVALV